MRPEHSFPISFSLPLVEAIRMGRKTVTRRRFGDFPELMEEPDRYHLHGLDAAGAHFAETATGRRLPACGYPFGLPGNTLLQVAEAPELLLEVVAVRVERVRAITAAGAMAEGIRFLETDPDLAAATARWGGIEPNPIGDFCWYNDPIAAFSHLLSSFYPLAWERNAWVWVIEFRRAEV